MDSLLQFLPWIITYLFLITGLIGAFFPVIPSHLLILFAGISHYAMLKEDSGLGITTLVVLALFLVASQTFEMLSGSIGSKSFGGSKWGPMGAITGVMVGLFFPPFGFIIGPLVGALLFEKFFGKKNLKDATTSGVGSAVGTLSGLLVRLIVAFLMTIYLLLDIYVLK